MFIHIDLDSFFISAHRTIDPSLIGVPAAVGSRSNLDIFDSKRNHTKLINNNQGAFVAPVFDSVRQNDFRSRFVDRVDGKDKIRGIIVTSSYEARQKGVKTAMSIAQALHLCPDMIVVPSEYTLYHHLSFELSQFLQYYIPAVEQFSIDEWFGDLSGWVKDEDVVEFCSKIQQDIQKIFDLPVSIGIAKSKWIAKLATEDAKPIGIKYVRENLEYIQDIPIEKFPGIGKGFATKLKHYGIHTLGQIAHNKSLLYGWKKPGIQLYHRVCGDDNEPILKRGIRKSIGLSRTFDAIYDKEEIQRRVLIMCRNIVYIIFDLKLFPSSYYLKINYEYNVKAKKTLSSSRKFSEKLFKEILMQIFDEIFRKDIGVIKLSINVTNFSKKEDIHSLFTHEEDLQQNKLTVQVQKLRKKFGLDIIKNASEICVKPKGK
ncbi:MAG: DNA polymerase IV [Campylobacterota bacterium]|nr:DNA polymerase IV [Campylobacterota bacterium]